MSLAEVGKTLAQHIKDLVVGVTKNQPSSNQVLFGSLVRAVYDSMKVYIALLSPEGKFINQAIENEAKILKEAIRELFQKGKIAFEKGNTNGENKQMEHYAKAMIESIKKINQARSQRPIGTHSVKLTLTKDSPTSTGGSKHQSGTFAKPSVKKPPQASEKPPTDERIQIDKMIRKSRQSINLARQSVQEMFSTLQQQQQQEQSSTGRSRSNTMQQNKLLQQALAQIAAMEHKMNDMEKKMQGEYKKGGSSSPGFQEADVMQMLFQLQQKLQDTEKAIESERKVLELERALKQRESEMVAREEAMTKRLEKVLELVDVNKVEQIEAKLKTLDSIIANPNFLAGGGGLPARGLDILKKEIERLQKIIFDDSTSEKDKDLANIELEKVMKELEKSPEFMEEQKKQKEEWLKIQEPLNKAAFEKVSTRLKSEAASNPQAFREKLGKSPELTLILLSKEAILKKHESDFKMYALQLSEEELRALLYNMPKFRSDQRTQASFADSLENKIKEKSSKPVAPPPIPRSNRVKKPFKPKKIGGGGGGGSFLDELKKKRAPRN